MRLPCSSRSPSTPSVSANSASIAVALVLGEPAGAVERGVGLLAAGQRQLDGALRPEALLAIAHQVVDPDRGLRLHVAGAAAVEIAVLLDQRERIARPVLALGLDDVDVREHQDRLGAGIGAVQDAPAGRLPSDGRPARRPAGPRPGSRRPAGARPCAAPRACSRRPTAWCWSRPAPGRCRGIAASHHRPGRPRRRSGRMPAAVSRRTVRARVLCSWFGDSPVCGPARMVARGVGGAPRLRVASRAAARAPGARAAARRRTRHARDRSRCRSRGWPPSPHPLRTVRRAQSPWPC